MRVIVEVDNKDELQEALNGLSNHSVTVITASQARSQAERKAILQRLYKTYRIQLPEDWKFDREEAHER